MQSLLENEASKGESVPPDRPPEVYRGRFSECWKRFVLALDQHYPLGKKGSGAIGKREMIAQFCGVTEDSVRCWMVGKFSPIGATYYKLMCFLDSQGYRVMELEKYSAPYRAYVEMVGYGLNTFEGYTKLTGYSKTFTVTQIFRNRKRLNKDAEAILWDLWQKNRHELERRKAAVPLLISYDASPVHSPVTLSRRGRRRSATLPVQPQSISHHGHNEAPVGNKLVANAVEVMIGVIDGCTREDLPVESIRRLLAKLNRQAPH